MLIIDCDLQWPVRRMNDRAVFQFGRVGGASIEEYYHGGPRVAAYLEAYGDSRRKWTPPTADELTMESEWGFEPRLNVDLGQIALDAQAQLKRLSFNQPEDLSAFVADFYRDWLVKTGRSADWLVAESFMLLDPHLVLQSGSVPFWLVFNAKPSVEVLHRFLDEKPAFREIFISLFPNGVEAVGQATTDDWQSVLGRATERGDLLGVDRSKFPADLAALVRYSQAMERLKAINAPPGPVPFQAIDEFASRWVGTTVQLTAQ